MFAVALGQMVVDVGEIEGVPSATGKLNVEIALPETRLTQFTEETVTVPATVPQSILTELAVVLYGFAFCGTPPTFILAPAVNAVEEMVQL